MGYSKEDFEGTTSFLTGNELKLHDQNEGAHPSLLTLLKKHLEDELAKGAELKDNKNKAGGYAGLDANRKIPPALISTITTSLLGKGAVTKEKLAAELIEELKGFVVKEDGMGLSEVNYTKDRDESVQKIAGILTDIYNLKLNCASNNALNEHVSDGTVHMTAAEREVFLKTAEGLVKECEDVLQKVIKAKLPVVHADTDIFGDYFVEAIEGIEDPLKIPLGTTICFVPGATSQSTQVRLGIGGTKDNPLAYYNIKRYLSLGTLRSAFGATADWLTINNPYIMSFNGNYWVIHGLTKPSAADLHSQVPVANGGTGAATPKEARANLGIVQGVPIVNATSPNGKTYIAIDDSITELKMGTFITFITTKTSTTVDVVLNLNGFGAKEIKRSTSDGQQYAEISNSKWLTADIPYTLMYDGACWVAADLPQPQLSDVSGLLSIEHGGTGGSTAETARENLGAAAMAETANAIVKTMIGRQNVTITDISPFVHPIQITVRTTASRDTVEIWQDGIMVYTIGATSGTLELNWKHYKGSAGELVFKATEAVTIIEVTYNADTNAIVDDVETALDTLIEQNETILAQQNAIIEMQNSLIGGDEA